MLNIEDFICNFRNSQSHIENGSKCVCNLFGTDYHYYFAKMKSIYDNGITTWDTLENVGHYEIDNTISE